MDVRESRIVDAINRLTIEEGLGILDALIKAPNFKDVPLFRAYLCRQVGEHVKRANENLCGEPVPPDLAEMGLLPLAQWCLGAMMLHHVAPVGGIEGLADAIVECVAVQAASVLMALDAVGVEA
jgi:hypothetical protein